MKLYKDKNLTHEITELDLGIVRAGESKEYTFWLYNETIAYLQEITCTIDHKEIELLECPEELSAHTVGELKVRWNPSITLKEGLKAPISIEAEEIWG